MTAIFKALILATPALAVVLWYTVIKMEKQEVQMEQHNVEFQKKQDDFNQEFEVFLNNPKKEAALYAKRNKERLEKAEERKKEAEELKRRRAEADRRDKEFVGDFEQALKEFEQEKITKKEVIE